MSVSAIRYTCKYFKLFLLRQPTFPVSRPLPNKIAKDRYVSNISVIKVKMLENRTPNSSGITYINIEDFLKLLAALKN